MIVHIKKGKEMKEYEIGYTSCFIKDHPFNHLTSIPVAAAVEWVKAAVPNQNMDGNILAKDLTVDGNIRTDARENGWLNNLFIIVGFEHDKFIAIYNHDATFHLAMQE
jgi:hypothetical protein